MRTGVVVLVLLLAGCSPSTPAPVSAPADLSAATPLPIVSSTPDTPARYTSLDEVIAELECAELSRDDPSNRAETLRGRATCSIGTHIFVIWLIEYGTHDWDQVREDGAPSIKGPGWIVVAMTGDEAARYAHGRLGGEVQLIEH